MLELNRKVVLPGGFQFAVSDGLLRLSENVDTRRKNISVFNQVERLNKNPVLFINYLRILAANKGMGFTIDQEVVEREEARAKDPRTNYKLQSILQAPEITHAEYEELSTLKKQGNTTTEENFKVEHCFWQRYLAQKELDPKEVYRLIALNALLNKSFKECSNALSKLENLPKITKEEKEQYEELAIAIFTKYTYLNLDMIRRIQTKIR